jgi:hypothetical protein
MRPKSASQKGSFMTALPPYTDSMSAQQAQQAAKHSPWDWTTVDYPPMPDDPKLAQISCEKLTKATAADVLAADTPNSDLVTELRAAGGLPTPAPPAPFVCPICDTTKSCKHAKGLRKLSGRITNAIVDTLATHHVRVVKSTKGRSVLPLPDLTFGAAGQRARQRQLSALGSLLDVAIVAAAVECDRDAAQQSLAKATRRHETAEVLRSEGERYLSTKQSELERIEKASAEQLAEVDVLKARWDKSMEQVNATAARNAVHRARRQAEADGGFLAQAMATNDPDLRAGYLEMLTGGKS